MIRTPEEQYLHELIESYVAPLRSEIKELRKELAGQQVKNLNIPTVMGELTCDSCGCHPNVIYTTSKGKFCESCKPFTR
jgi:hypothetical protein